MINQCQYCKAPCEDSYTCTECNDGWPTESCRCENNGDYCEACETFIEFRQMCVRLGRTPKASENPYINERYREELLREEND